MITGVNRKPFLILLILAFAIVTSFPAAAETLMVDPTGEGDYMEVQAAIDAANPGDTILVKKGTYEENLRIDKELKIWSNSRNPADTIIQAADPAENVVEVTTNRVTFSGFGITGSENAGIYLEGAGNCYINNNKVSNTAQGIFLSASDRNVVSNNILSLNELGIGIESSGRNIIQTNTIAYNYGSGISLEESSENQIYDNYFKNSENVRESPGNQDNFWNVALTSKRNIVGGPYTAGNFWADPQGSGYSETCIDENNNGICDSPYSINGGATDELPLYPKVPEGVLALESRLDPEAYEKGVSGVDETVTETESVTEEPEEGEVTEGEVTEGEVVEEEAGEEEAREEEAGEVEPETEPEEAAEEANSAPGFAFAITCLAIGMACLLKRER